jgi:hypothetical protein
MHAKRSGDRFDEPNLLLDRRHFGVFGALRSNRRPRAAGDEQQTAADQEVSAV